MSRRGTIKRRCSACARYAEKSGARWVCPTDPEHRLRWSALVDIAPRGSAKRRQIRKSFDTRDEALAWLAESQVSAANRTRVEPSKLTLELYLTDWLGGLGMAQLEAGTVSWYRSAVERHIIPTLGAIRLQDLDATTIEAFLADKATSGRIDGAGGLGPASVRRLAITLHKSLDAAVKKRLISVNPADLADKPKIPPRDVTEEIWSPETMGAFLSAANGRNTPIWHVACWTGLRRSELAGLQWGDIDLEAGVLSVKRARTQVDGHPVVKGPKSAASRRTVDLDSDTIAVLRGWKKTQLEERMRVGPGWEPGEWVFTDELGAPWRPDRLTRAFVRAVRAAGLPPTDIKGLRHAHATALLRAGVHPKVVQERLGHSSIAVTMDIYSSVLPGMQREAVEKLAAMMGGK